MKHKDGRWVWVHDRGRLVTRTADGQPLMMFGTHTDITARKQAEAALRESEARLRTLVDANPESFFLMDPAGIVLVANEVVARRLGRTREQLLGTNIFDLLPPGVAQYRRAQLDEAARIGGMVRFEDVRLDANIDNYVHPLADEAGKLSGFAILGVDTTRYRQAEAALRESEVRYRTLADGGQALIWTSGLDKKCDFFNQRWLKFTGRTFEQEQGDGWAEGVHPDDLARCFATYSTAFDRRECFSMDYRLRRHDGEYRWIQDDGTPRYDSQGNFLGFIGHCLDITERKLGAEAMLRFQEQLRALSARQATLREEERTRIAREIHDELGQLLTGLKMDLHCAEDLVSDWNDARLNPLLDKLVAITELTNTTILTVQRIASELRPGVLDRLGLIMALHHEANQFERRSGLRCVLQIPQEEPALYPEVATAFFRIFQEALTNTARHASARNVQASFRPEAGHWVLEVQDDGRGLTESEAANPGSLGLLGMQERARLLDGTVTFGRAPNGGTVVTVRLPRREVSPTEMP
jgi:PAS domain S-box-containing protein